MSDWKNVIATTCDLKADYQIIDIVNVTVTGDTWKNDAKALQLDLDTGFWETQSLDSLFMTATALVKYKAHQMGANAVIGLEFDVDTDNAGWFLTGFGTAVKS